MLSEAERDALEHIRDNIARAMRFVDGLDLDGFLRDDKTFYAVTRCLEIISEASRRLPKDFKARFPEIPWKAMAGSDSIYRHDYEDVQERRVWATIHEALPPLRAIVDAELSQAYQADIGSRLDEARQIPFEVVAIGDWRPRESDCHHNVDTWVAAHPESVPARGWMIYANSGESVGLCSHSVVQGPDGELFDITPLHNENDRLGLRFVRHRGSSEEFEQERNRNDSFFWPPINYGSCP